jgi:hypothetical protein
LGKPFHETDKARIGIERNGSSGGKILRRKIFVSPSPWVIIEADLRAPLLSAKI